MLIKNLKILIFIIFFLYQNSVFSKTNDLNEFNHRYLSNYFSAIVSFDNQNNDKALKFFNSSKYLIKKHDNFLREYTISLVENGQILNEITSDFLSQLNSTSQIETMLNQMNFYLKNLPTK